MTDSMKFGPEWLRNMSADTTSSNANNSGCLVTNSSSVFSSGSSSGGGEGISANNVNSSANLNSNTMPNNVIVANSGFSRNTFPEFRYGREEMLLLFDRNCVVPEILPSYKNLFVERVQFPLALVPSTDEDMLQSSAPPTQKPGWLQRSPVGFSTVTRGSGRVGCMERGRMRGKSIYHPVFPRPNGMFDEEQRSSTMKADRSWVERNGGPAGDSNVPGPSTVVGGTLNVDSWNGSTPVSSPRREFSNHPKNLENWRRSRNEDGSSGESANPPTFSAEGGWRMNSSFQNSHTRWGRSTSWRDDELTSCNDNSGITASSGSPAVSGAGIVMLRSNSTISSAQCERVGHTTASSKHTGSIGVARSLSVSSSASRNTTSGNIWPNLDQAVGSNITSDVNINDEMPLPEWAMENPSGVGGTFDASGAFHGAMDDEKDGREQQPKDEENAATEAEEKSAGNRDDDPRKAHESPTLNENDNNLASSLHSPSPTNDGSLNSIEMKSKINKNCTENNNSPTDAAFEDNTENISSENEDVKETISSQTYSKVAKSDEENLSISAGDYAERTMKVTDDMIEKLIRDEENKEDQIKLSMLSDGNKKNTHHVFSSEPQNTNHPTTVSPSLGGVAGPTSPPNISMYNMSGIMVDHSHSIVALHQLQQQQQQMAAVGIGLQPTQPTPHPMASSAPADLWFYRDPQSKVQGPFSALEMTEWYRAGYFNENLFVRRVCDVRFRPLGELIKICNGQMPFSHSHLIPIDLNPTALTPPLAPVISTQSSAQATDFVIKTLNEHQQHQQHEKLKGNVTAAADSLSNALKSLINSVDISQVLNMHFQTLQNRFIHNQEIEIVNELSKNDCFRQLTAAEQDALVRQKLQRMVLPEYLTNLTGLSNSLAALNPTAGTQLYDTIAECTKKEQLFNNQSQPHPQTPTPQNQQHSNHHSSSSNTYVNPEEFILKTKGSGSDMNSNDLLNEFSLRMFLNNGSDSGVRANSGVVASPSSHAQDYINDQPLFTTGTSSMANQSNNAPQSPMMQMWMNSLTANQSGSHSTQQHPLIISSQQATGVNNQWLNGPLVGIPSINLNREQHGGGSIISSPKPLPASMWDVSTLEHVQVQQKQHEQQLQHQMLQQNQTFEHDSTLKDSEKHSDDQQQHTNKHVNKEHQQRNQQSEEDKQEDVQNQANDIQKSTDVVTKTSSTNDNKHEERVAEKPQQNNNSNNKRNCTNNNNNVAIGKTLSSKAKMENVEEISKKTEEDRRREQNEEKRRQKEERKRQQMEEEKRRLVQAEEEKRRQIQEEEKRQQQIQAQRRKALMSTSNNTCNNTNNSNNVGNNQKSKEHVRIPSSVAPWSTQTMATKSQGPGLAEIQKAERRERRADQQRQLEMQEKQMRALAAAAETQDTVLKWNAAPVPVKSFAEIQAEEAKRLVHEQMELQKRKEQETHNLITFSSASHVVPSTNNSSNISSIWSGNKIWGTTAHTSGFWEDPLKLNNKPTGSVGLSSSCNANNNLTAATVVSQSSTSSQKPSAAGHQNPSSSSNQQSSNKNVKKNQTIPTVQNSASSPIPNIGINNQKKSSNNTASSKQPKSQKSDNSNHENKKFVPKNNNTSNKGEDYESEFINWCTKSLNNMHAKVDVPTFVSFLRDLESPYEVKDYIRMYLGESKEYIDFAKQFLERRSKYKSLQRAQNAHDDDLCKPALAITPSVNDNSENKGKQKKVKKNKMTKLDARILGFSVTAAEGRINVGDRDYGDAP
ncbi:GIGYF family protein Gyf isoform 2-T3 [Cochliomyia hominivorax]